MVNAWTFLFQLLNFVVLVYVLRRLLYRPLHEAIDRRRAANARALAEAESMRGQAAAQKRQLEEQLAGLDRERQRAIGEVRDRAEAERQSLLAEAERAIQSRRDDVEKQLEQDRAEAARALRGELVDWAVALAERMVREAAGSSLQDHFVDRLIDALEHPPAQEGAEGQKSWQPEDHATLETAADLSGDQLARITRALEARSGRSVPIVVQNQPALVVGVRLLTDGHVWEATLHGGLEAEPEAAASSNR